MQRGVKMLVVELREEFKPFQTLFQAERGLKGLAWPKHPRDY